MIRKTLAIAFIVLFFKSFLFSFDYLEDKTILKIAFREYRSIFFGSVQYEMNALLQIGYCKRNSSIVAKFVEGEGDIIYFSDAYKELIKIEIDERVKIDPSAYKQLVKDKELMALCNTEEDILIYDDVKLFLQIQHEDADWWFEIIISDNGKKQKLEGYDFWPSNGNSDYIYIDRVNKHIYLVGYNFERSEDGILRYDIKTGKVDFVVKGNYIMAPIRIPNTVYLMFAVTEGEWEKGKYGYNIYIKEIPEWKAEIEKQEENKKLYPTARKAFIDGPANIRDKPKGKNTATLDDLMEVLILNQENDWYEILYANVRGWTYKDNLKDIK
jgi:hypothetical protein